jgi:hypothetical protein
MVKDDQMRRAVIVLFSIAFFCAGLFGLLSIKPAQFIKRRRLS